MRLEMFLECTVPIVSRHPEKVVFTLAGTFDYSCYFGNDVDRYGAIALNQPFLDIALNNVYDWPRDERLVERLRRFLPHAYLWHRLSPRASGHEVVDLAIQAVREGFVIAIPRDMEELRGSASAPVHEPPLFHPPALMPSQLYRRDNRAVLDATSFSPIGSGQFNLFEATSDPGRTQLTDAQSFEYSEAQVSSSLEQIAAGDGTPRNNQAQNKQFKDLVRAPGLNRSEAQRLHMDISGENLGYWEIMERARDLFRQ